MRPKASAWVAAAAVLASAWAGGLLWFADAVTRLAPTPGTTDAIVVLTGGSDRVAVGVALLAQDQARLLFVSGVPAGVDVTAVLSGGGAGAAAPVPGGRRGQ